MFTKTITGLCILVLAASFLFLPAPLALAQNIGANGRFPSDLGPGVFKYGTATDTTAQDMAPAPPTGVRNYIYQAACYSTSATVAVALIKDGSTTLAAVPCVPSSGLSQPIRFNPPLAQPTTATKLTMSASTSITTAYFYMAARTAR